MPASIVHMLVSKIVRRELSKDMGMQKFVSDVLEKHSVFMNLGSIGPDLPYYESMAKGAVNLLLQRSDRPMGVDQWSYQLHSKDPNIFPLKMMEITWKDTDMEKEDWEDDDLMKFAFICGFLTHVAADQIVHPLINIIAGPYYKRGGSREKHRECEIYQDLYMFGQLKNEFNLKEFRNEPIHTWCDLNPGFGKNTPVWFRYFIQKSFVEAHAVTPSEDNIEDWVDGTLLILRGIVHLGPYIKAMENNGDKKLEYIDLRTPPNAPDDKKREMDRFLANRKNSDYKSFFDEAVNLAIIYVKAAYRIYSATDLDDSLRDKFKEVVRNADLGAPLERDILKTSKEAFESWK